MASSSSGDILHFGAVRLRVTGDGNLHVAINSVQNIKIDNLADEAMLLATNREPLFLADYINQRGQIRVGTSDLGATFNISKMVVFTKVLYTGYPQ